MRNHMLVAGIDYSGDPETGSKFLGIVIGTQDAINSAMKRLGPGPPHVSKITNKRRRAEILSKLRFNGDTIIAICIRSRRRKFGRRRLDSRRGDFLGPDLRAPNL